MTGLLGCLAGLLGMIPTGCWSISTLFCCFGCGTGCITGILAGLSGLCAVSLGTIGTIFDTAIAMVSSGIIGSTICLSISGIGENAITKIGDCLAGLISGSGSIGFYGF